jgi:ubiquinol-cytochrome c reductase iron-sulfur subunit
MSGLALHRRGVLAMSASAWLACGATRSAESGEPVIAYWDDPIPVGGIARGDWAIAMLDGDPIFLRRRTEAQIKAARETPLSDLTDPAADDARAPGGEWLVVSGLCTHASCRVQAGLGPYEGWQCFCHGSVYDLSGRVRHGPARRNLPVIPHTLSGEAMVLKRP